MPTEDEVYGVICEEFHGFHRDGPAKSLSDRWQRKAARRVMALFAPKIVQPKPFVYPED